MKTLVKISKHIERYIYICICMCVCCTYIYIYVPYIICISRDAYGIAKILSLCLGNFQTQKQERKGKAGWPFADMERGRESIPSRNEVRPGRAL